MAWTAPVTRATGYVVLAADWNAEHVNNLQYLHGDAGPIALANGVSASGSIVANPGSLAATGNITTSGGIIGYTAGAGGTVTQITSRNTGVTLNTLSGAIITNGTSIASTAQATFVVTNSLVTTANAILLSVANNPVTGAAMLPAVTQITNGSFSISYQNTSGAATTQTLQINFAVISAAQS